MFKNEQHTDKNFKALYNFEGTNERDPIESVRQFTENILVCCEFLDPRFGPWFQNTSLQLQSTCY
jgi:hypothetical protein